MNATLGRAIIACRHKMDRWVVPSFALIPRRLPDGWTLARLGDCAKIVSNVVKVEPKAEYKHRSQSFLPHSHGGRMEGQEHDKALPSSFRKLRR